MKRIFLFFGVLIVMGVNAQTGIGTNTPNASAKLDVTATDKGFLPPRVALTASNAVGPIPSPATGLLVYNTATAGIVPNNVIPGYYFWNGSAWINFIGSTTANTIIGNGTTSTITNFGSVLNDQTGTSYTLQNIDNGKIITFNSSSPITVFVPSLSVGFNCMILQRGTGQVTLSPSGVTVSNRYSFNRTAGQFSILTLVCIASGIYVSSGDMSN
jgi:hypothetical protein